MKFPWRICRGATRTVFLAGAYAFKIPSCRSWRTFLHGLLSNMQEAEFGRTGWPELCPIRLSLPGGLLIIMDRAEPCEETLTHDDYCRLTTPQGKGYCIPAEWKPDSFGRLRNGCIVAIDYGGGR